MSYEVWGEPEEVPECPYCEENSKEKGVSDETVADLTLLVVRMSRSLSKASPDNALPKEAVNYLKRKDLLGTNMRGSDD